MSNPKDNPFSALSIAERLTPEQLEYITEFSDQVESLRFLSRNLPGPQPTLEQAIEIVGAAPAALRKRKKRDKVSFADKAWHIELGSEFANKKAREGERLPAVLSRGEIDILFEASSHDQRDLRDYLLLRVFYASAMRISEIEAMLKADLYLGELKIFVRDGKGDKDRYVMIDPETANLLAEYTKNHRPEDNVFKIGDRQISRIVEKWGEETGISDRYTAIGRNFTPHSFRHTCATHLYEAGMDLYVLSNLLGHSTLSVTREYIHIGINRERDQYQAYHPLCQPPEKEEDPGTVRS
jgi:site-specific recombinase XerD